MHVLATIPMTYVARNGDMVHSPLVAGTIASIDTLLVLDTGSEVHILTEELADALDLNKAIGEEGIDHSGATMPSWTVDDVAVDLSGYVALLESVVAIPAPPPFPAMGIGGILSPQHLHPTGWAVIDIAADELLIVNAADEHELRRFLIQRAPRALVLRQERDPSLTSIVVHAAIEPHAAIPALINTGGKRTEFAASAVPSLVAEAIERIGGGVSGADVAGSLVGEATVIIGGARLRVPELAIRPEMHDPQGIVGMDVLRNTIVACAADVARPVFLVLPQP